MWSFDRVCAGSAYVEAAVVPVLHRYNDAKYVWSDAVAREWLHGFVRAHGGARVGAVDHLNVGPILRAGLNKLQTALFCFRLTLLERHLPARAVVSPGFGDARGFINGRTVDRRGPFCSRRAR